MSIIKERNASAFLLLNAILWGSSYIWSKMLLQYLPYFTILFLFSLGGLISLFLIFFRKIKRINKKTAIAGIAVGFIWIMSNIFCMLALKGTSSSNTAFIVQLSVVITPLLMSLYRRKSPGVKVVFGAMAALAGLLLLTFDFSSFRFSIGDLFAMGNALFFSLYLVALKIFFGTADAVQVTFMQHAAGTLVFLSMALTFESRRIWNASIDTAGLSILILSIVISVTTILIQSRAIQFTRPEKATIIYTMEPLTAAVLAYILTGERPAGIHAVIGCMLIIAAVVSTINIRQFVATQKPNNNVEYTYLQQTAAIRRKAT